MSAGKIDRRIFSDPEIFDREMKLIFGRSWPFVGHESQVREPGDFFEAPMGRDHVLVVRQRDGSVKDLLNACTHQGNAVCRAEEGNVRNFMCTYHGCRRTREAPRSPFRDRGGRVAPGGGEPCLRFA